MLAGHSANPTRVAFAAGVLLALAAGTGVVFALWAENGSTMFRALVESGLAWCF